MCIRDRLNTVEKIQVARQLEALGVDVIEAGFPISSPGDFNSVIETVSYTHLDVYKRQSLGSSSVVSAVLWSMSRGELSIFRCARVYI